MASCYLQKAGDENNACYLSETRLFIRRSGKLDSFLLEDIKKIDFQDKLMMFPMILGGIISPLSLIALFNDVFSPWLTMGSFIGGLFLLYYGYEGGNTLTVTTNVKEFDFFIKSSTKNLKSFISFVSRYRASNAPPAYYVLILEKEWLNARQHKQITFTASKELLEKPVFKNGYVTLLFEPLSANVQVNYRENQQGELTPHMEGPISTTDLQPVSP